MSPAGSDGSGEFPERIGLAAFNAMPAAQAHNVLLACCRAPHWADAVAAGRPYPSLGALLARAGDVLTSADVTEALAGHPRIGESPSGAAGAAGASGAVQAVSAMSRREQAGVAGAGEQVLAGLAEGNAAYEQRFGHIYLVCAAGRSAAELLQILRERLRNDPDTERMVVHAELRKINKLRLERLIGS